MSYLQETLKRLASLPEEDAAALRSSQNEQQTRSLALSRIEHHAAHISTLGTLYNLGSPMHRLPNEILMAILYRCRRSLADIRLAHVCRHWRAVISAMPEFWAALLRDLQFGLDTVLAQRGRSHEELLKQCLELSAPRMIQCHLSFNKRFECRLLAPHIHRITELSVVIWRSRAAQDLATVLTQGMPNLETLRCHSLGHNPIYWSALPTLETCPLPRLTRLDVSGECPVQRLLTRSTAHLIIRGWVATGNLRELVDALNSHSFTSLTLDATGLDVWNDQFSPGPVIPHIRAIVVRDRIIAVEQCLRRLGLPPSISVNLSFMSTPPQQEDLLIPSRLAETLREHLHGRSAITCFYLGNTRSRGRVRLRGYADPDNIESARLDIGQWHEGKCAVWELLELAATSSAATVLTISLPGRLAEFQCPHRSRTIIQLPLQLRRLELLNQTPLSTRLWLARSFLRLPSGEAPLHPEESTLCWVLHVGRDNEALAREELKSLEGILLMESSHCKLGRLEFYGTLARSGQVYTKVADVPTNRARCATFLRPFLIRFSGLVGQLVMM